MHLNFASVKLQKLQGKNIFRFIFIKAKSELFKFYLFVWVENEVMRVTTLLLLKLHSLFARQHDQYCKMLNKKYKKN